MLRESYFSGVWLAWCYARSSPAGMERARRAEQAERESLESAARTLAPPPIEAPARVEDDLSPAPALDGSADAMAPVRG